MGVSKFLIGEGGDPQITCNVTSLGILKEGTFYRTKIFYNGRTKVWVGA